MFDFVYLFVWGFLFQGKSTNFTCLFTKKFDQLIEVGSGDQEARG